MPGTVIGKSLNLGYAGKRSRSAIDIVGARPVKSILSGSTETMSAVPFGKGVVLNTDNTYSLFGQTGTGVSAATLANFGGVAVGEVKQMTTYGNISGAGQYEPAEMCDVLQFGSCTVVLADGVPTAGGTVHICTVAGGAIAIGDFVASTTPTGGGTAIALTGVEFKTNKKDANNVVEITMNNRVNP